MSPELAHAERSPAQTPALAETQAANSPIPFKREAQSMGNDIGQSLSILILLIALAWSGLYAARKFIPRLKIKDGAGKRLQLIEVLRLTPRTTLFVVRFDEQTLLLGQHGENVTVLDIHPAGGPPPQHPAT
jgi:flagellar biogenesis protein FliO